MGTCETFRFFPFTGEVFFSSILSSRPTHICPHSLQHKSHAPFLCIIQRNKLQATHPFQLAIAITFH